MTYADEVAQAVGYDSDVEGSVDALIAYKNALEDASKSLRRT